MIKYFEAEITEEGLMTFPGKKINTIITYNDEEHTIRINYFFRHNGKLHVEKPPMNFSATEIIEDTNDLELGTSEIAKYKLAGIIE